VEGTLVFDPGYESDYCMDLGDEVALEPQAPFRFLNHSCQPNCALVRQEYGEAEESGEPDELWVECVADVEPGQELTIDYGWPADAAIPCGCDSPSCRGWVVAQEELGRLAYGDTPACPTAESA
jgi:hypothetical protein